MTSLLRSFGSTTACFKELLDHVAVGKFVYHMYEEVRDAAKALIAMCFQMDTRRASHLCQREFQRPEYFRKKDKREKVKPTLKVEKNHFSTVKIPHFQIDSLMSGHRHAPINKIEEVKHCIS
jgi:hypothetical protein